MELKKLVVIRISIETDRDIPDDVIQNVIHSEIDNLWLDEYETHKGIIRIDSINVA